MEKGFRNRNFGLISRSNKKYLLYVIIGLVIIGAAIFFFIFMKNKNAVPGIKMVSGTEYISGEQGQVIIRLENSRHQSITDANCILSLLYPDKSFFLVDVPMQHTSIPGNYYHPFITPQTPGIYEEFISCTIVRDDVPTTLHISYAFHVSPGLNLVVEMSKSQREQYNDLINRVNNLDSNLRAQINAVDNRVQNLQTFVDSNVMGNIQNLNQDVQDINVSLNDSVNGIEGRLNNTMLNNFDELYSKFKASYNAMSNIFDSNR